MSSEKNIVTVFGVNKPARRKITSVGNVVNLQDMVNPDFDKHCVPAEQGVACEHNGLLYLLNNPSGIGREIESAEASTIELRVLIDPSPGEIQILKFLYVIKPFLVLVGRPTDLVRMLAEYPAASSYLIENYRAMYPKGTLDAFIVHDLMGPSSISRKKVDESFPSEAMQSGKTNVTSIPEPVVIPETPKMTQQIEEIEALSHQDHSEHPTGGKKTSKMTRRQTEFQSDFGF